MVPTTRQILEDYIWCRTDSKVTAEERSELTDQFNAWVNTIRAQAIHDTLQMFPGKSSAWVRDRLKGHAKVLEDN